MTNNDMGPMLGFILISMLALILFSSFTGYGNTSFRDKALKILDNSFSEYSSQNENISELSLVPLEEKTNDNGILQDSLW